MAALPGSPVRGLPGRESLDPSPRTQIAMKAFKSPACPTLSSFSPGPRSAPKPQISGLELLQIHNPIVSCMVDIRCCSGLGMSSDTFGRNHHETVEVFKKCPRQLEKRRKQQDPGLPELGETVNSSIRTFIQSVNKHLVKAYYVPRPLLHLCTGGTMMNRT